MAQVDIKNTRGFFRDDRIDTAGGGAYERELTAGATPNKTSFREHDSILETVNLRTPKGLRAGIQIRNTSRGTEISRVEYDARHEAQLYLVNREFNTPTAERVNGRMDGVAYVQGHWQGKTVHDVVAWIVEQTGGTLAYDGSAPAEYAGPIAFRNTPAPQAIDQVLQLEGNNLWTVLGDGRTVTVVNRVPGGGAVGEVGVNVVEQSLTGAEVKTDRPAKVTDRDGRGLKTQHGGPAWVGRDQPVGETFGAEPPLELEIDLSDLARAAGGADKISEAYKFTRHTEDGSAGWHFPRDAAGNPVKAQVRLVQKGVMRDDGVSRRKPDEPGYVKPRGFWSKLLTHPNLGLAFEAKVAGAPIYYKKQVVLASKLADVRAAYRAAIDRANGRITKDITDSPTLRKALLATIESGEFNRRDANGTVAPHAAIAIVALFDPEWVFVNGFVDLDAGELTIDAGNASQFHHLVSATSFGDGEAVEIGWSFDAAHGSNAGPTNPVPMVKVRFAQAARAAKFRAHVVTTKELGPEISPAEGKAPFGAIEAGDFQKHNVIENAARLPGFLEPLDRSRDDTARMKRRAENLARTLELPAMARGAIRIFPGDERLRVGQPANGGVIVKIKHTYVPFFTTQFWLEGTPDVDSFERKHWRKKIGEFEGLTQVNSASILEARSRTDSTGQGSAAMRVPPHTHTDDQTGGTTLGEVEASSLTIYGTTPDGQPALYATRGGKGATVDLKEVLGLGRLVSGDLLLKVTRVAADGTVDGRIHDDPSLPEIKRVGVLVNGRVVAGHEVARLVDVGDVRPIMFLEHPDPARPAQAVIVIDETRLVCDHHQHDDEAAKNESSRVFGVDKAGAVAGDLDDLFIVERLRTSRFVGPDGPEQLELTAIGDPRLMLYLAERGFEGEARRGVVTGPHIDSGNRHQHKSGHMADVLRYWRSRRNANRLGLRSDAVFVSDDPKGEAEHAEDEGPLDFASLHADLPAIADGIKGAPLVFDRKAWNGPGGEPRGQRWKTILVADHIQANHQGVPTERCKNESTQVWQGDLSDRGDLDDILAVHDERLMLYMENQDPCGGSRRGSTCDPEDRFGWVTDRQAKAWLSDVLEYEEPEGKTRLDLKASSHFKLTAIGGPAILDGPLPFLGPVQGGERARFHPPTEFLYGWLGLDRTLPACGGKGTWVIEVPFDPCASPALVAQLRRQYDNIEFVNELQADNVTQLEQCQAKAWGRLCGTTIPYLMGVDQLLHREIIAGRGLLRSVQAALQANIQATAAALRAEIAQVAASSTAADAALASAISACACCFPEAPPTTSEAGTVATLTVDVPGPGPIPDSPGCATPECPPPMKGDLKPPCKVVRADDDEDRAADFAFGKPSGIA